MNTCGVTKKNLGVGLCNDLPQIFRRHITTDESFVATKAQVESRTFWQQQIALGNAYYWPQYSDVPEYIGTETTYRDNPVNYSKIIDGRYRWRVKIEKNLCFHKAANSHSGRGGRFWPIDAGNKIFGTYAGVNESDVDIYAGFTMDLFNAENMMFNDGTNPSESPFVIALSDPSEVNDSVYGATAFNFSFASLLQPLTDVTIEPVTTTTSLLVVDVYLGCDGTPVSGLVLADFVVLEADLSTAVVPSSVTESATIPGRYSLASTAAFEDDGTIALDPAADLSVYPQSVYASVATPLVIPLA